MRLKMDIPVKKNEEYIVNIIDNGFEGEGITKIDGFTIFVPNAIKGEEVKILIVKVLTSHAYAKLIEIIKKSENRIEPDCATYKRCGGCNLRHLSYDATLDLKQNIVQNLVKKNLKSCVNVNKTWGMGNPYNYRNKLQYPVGKDKNGNIIVGVFANRTHEIIKTEECLIQNKKANEIAKFIVQLAKKYDISVYDENNQQGLLRHIVIKTGIRTNEIMVILVINGDSLSYQENFLNELKNKYNEIESIVLNINKKNTNVILGDKNINLLGNGYIKDILGDYYFRISPLSFYQVNPVQAEALYNIAIEGLNITKQDVVFDLYCGIGTISIFASKYAKKVYGVEIVEQAIKDAKWNSEFNKIENTKFIAGDTEKVIDDLINNKKIIPNIVIVDPPRKGLDRNTINNIIKIHPKKIAYISCNPATLVRDLAYLEDMYKIEMIQPVDMFPWTSHVECCVVITLRDNL